MNKKPYNTKRLTAHYAVTFAVFFGAFCMVRSFITVYLLDRGFSYTQVGIITGIHMLFAAVIQPLYSRILERFPKTGLRRFTALCCIPAALTSLLTFILPARMVLFIPLYILFGIFEIGMQSLMVSLGMEYVNAGVEINPGIGRGFGSAGYAAANVLLGMLIVRFGSPISHALNIGLMLLLAVLLFTMPDVSSISDQEDGKAAEASSSSDSFSEFLRSHRFYAVFVFSIVCLFFGHSIVNTYMPDISGQFGLGSDFTGIMNGLAAILELIPMLLSVRISKRISAASVLRFSAVFFTIKILVTTLARNAAGIAAGQCLQLFAYACYVMSSVYYTNQMVQPKNRLMAQGLAIGAGEIGFMIGSFVTGLILDHFDIRTLLWTGVGITLMGTLLMLIALRPADDRKSAAI